MTRTRHLPPLTPRPRPRFTASHGRRFTTGQPTWLHGPAARSRLHDRARSLAAAALLAGAGCASDGHNLTLQARSLPPGDAALSGPLHTTAISESTWSEVTAQTLAPMCDASQPAPLRDVLLAGDVSRLLADAAIDEGRVRDVREQQRQRSEAAVGAGQTGRQQRGRVSSATVSCAPAPSVVINGEPVPFELIYARVSRSTVNEELTLLGYSPSTGDIGAMTVTVTPRALLPPSSYFVRSSVRPYGVPASPPIVQRTTSGPFRLFFASPGARSGVYAIAPTREMGGSDVIRAGRFRVE